MWFSGIFPSLGRGPGALKYRCPNAAYGLDCAGRSGAARRRLEAADYGPVVHVVLTTSDRMFAPTPWAASEAGYARHDELERINVRLDGSFRFENHFVCGRRG